jgi:hypothetical protein
MKKSKQLLACVMLGATFFLSSFAPNNAKRFPTYFWFNPSNVFLDHNTLGGEEVTTGFDTNSANGTLQENGFTSITNDGKPAGTLAFKLYSHP